LIFLVIAMPRPIHAVIHIDALAHNLVRARQAIPDAKVWAIVKANAYGHGIERVFEGLRAADGFGLLDLAEAQRIRDLGWRGPILLLEGCFEPRDLELCSRLNLWHVVHTDWQIDALAHHKTHQAHRVFLKLNSGMSRLGFSPPAFRSAWARLNALPQVEEVSLMTHFADADRVQGIAMPLQVFNACTHDLPGERSLCNSAAILGHGSDPQLCSDWIRPGIMLYGSAPDFPTHSSAAWGLKPAMSLRSALIEVRDVPQGGTVGYGSLFVAAAPMRVGIVACGYADGYPRIAPTGTPILIDGVRTRTLGRVSMDMIAVDLTPVPQACIGSEAVMWGCSRINEAVLPIDEVAQSGQTLGYELMCALALRVPAEVE
jgi:alanine racemase